ncbi:MAG: DUF2339 domain-containing protein [Mariniphaga sp.]
MQQRRSHRTKIRRNSKSSAGFGRYLNPTVIIILGSLFLLVGLYSTLSALLGPNGIGSIVASFLAPSIDTPVIAVNTTGGVMELLFWFSPALILLVGSLLFAKRYGSITHPVSVLVVIYLFVIQVILFLKMMTNGGTYYENILSAGLFLSLTVILLFALALLHKKQLLLILTCCYFYATVILYTSFFGTPYDFLFPGVILFSFLIYFIGKKIDRPEINLINLFFAVSYWCLFWFRNFIVNAKTNLFPQFFILGILFYILFMGVAIFAFGKKENPVPRWVQLTFTGSNLLFFAGTTVYVLMHYFAAGYMGIYVVTLILIQLSGLYFIKKTDKVVWTLPHHFSLILLMALALPLLFQEYRIICFTALLSVLMIGYANRFKERSAFWISLGSVVVMAFYFLFTWVRTCIPTLFDTNIQPETGLQLYGLLVGVLVAGALAFVIKAVQTSELELSQVWFSKRKYERIIRAFMYFTIFLTMGWLMFIIAFQLTGSVGYTTVAWFISGSLFFIGAIRQFAGRKSSFKLPALYIALAFALLYPPLVHWNMLIYRTGLIMMHQLDISVLFLHYAALVLLLILGRMIINRIYKREQKKNEIKQSVEIFTILTILFLLFTEYDNLSVILGRMQSSPISGGSFDADILVRNMYLPYSLIVWVVAVFAFIRSITRKHLILRNFSMVLYIAMVIKIFAVDFESLSVGARSVVFLLLGLFLIGFAVVYPKLLKGKSVLPEFKRGESGSKKSS